jgi:hypothetical protein
MRRTGAGGAIAVATLVGGALRLTALGDKPFWLDENATFLSLRHLWDRGPDAPVFVQASNLLYYGLLWVWTQVFGDSAAALRGLSAAAGIACIPLGAAFAARLGGPSAARAAAVLIALHPLHIHYSREARAYALWTLLVLAATAALWRAAVRGDRRSWVLAAAAWLGAFGAHVFTLFALPATAAAVLWASDRRAALWRWLGLAALVGGAAALHVPLLLRPALEAGAGAWLETWGWHPLGALADSIWSLLPAGRYPGYLDGLSLGSTRTLRWLPTGVSLASATVPLLVVPVALLALRSGERGPRDWRPLAALAAGPLATLWLASLAHPVFLAGRYDLVAWPALTLWIALGLAALGRRRHPAGRVGPAGLLAAIVLALCTVDPIGRVLRYDGGDRFDARRAARLAALVTESDLVIAFSNDDDALAHALYRAGFRGRMRPFPAWLGRQIAFLDSPRDLSRARAPALARDAGALEREIAHVHERGGAVYWLGDALRLDGRGARATLPARLEAQLRAAGLRRVPVDESLAIDRLERGGPGGNDR